MKKNWDKGLQAKVRNKQDMITELRRARKKKVHARKSVWELLISIFF